MTAAYSYTARKVACREAACCKLRGVGAMFLLRLLFRAWLEDYKESRRARRWFNREGGSEGAGNDAEGEWHWEDGEDPISLLPRDVAVKV